MGVVKTNRRSQEEIYRSLGLPYSGTNTSGPSGGNRMIDPTPGYVTPRANAVAKVAGAAPISAVTGTKVYQTGVTPTLNTGAIKAMPRSSTASRASYADDLDIPEFSLSDRTQDYYDRLDEIENDRPDPFATSKLTDEYLSKLQKVEGEKPDAFQSKYTAQIDSLLNTIQNPEKFDLGSNDTYRQLYDNYKESYMAQGRKAMQDAVGQAAAMTGGYGSSYASQVGQQAYDNYLQQLNDRNIQLYGMALDDYWKNRNDYYNQLNAVSGQDQVDYGRYRDTVGDWKDDRAYYANRYDTGYNRDYTQYRDTVGDWQTDRAYYANQAQTGYGNDWASYQSGLDQYNQAQQMAFQQAQADQAQANWQAELDRADAANLLNGLNTRAVIDAWNNPDDPAKQAALQTALQTAQAAKAKSSGGSGGRSSGGSSSGRRSYGSGSKTAKDVNDLTVDRFAGQLQMAMNNGEISHTDAEKAIKDYVYGRKISESNIEKIAKKAGVNLQADENQREYMMGKLETLAGQARVGLDNGEITNQEAIEWLYDQIGDLDLTDAEFERLAKKAGIKV